MKICRFNDNRLGLVRGNDVLDVTDALKLLKPMRWPVPLGDQLVAELSRIMKRIAKLADAAPALPLDSVRLLSPVANPSKIMAAPLNYRLHVDESQKDAGIHHNVHLPNYEGYATPPDKFGVFLKANSSLVGPSEGVRLYRPDRRNDHEVELAVVIGRKGRAISRADAMSYVAGYCIGLDMTVRGPEDRSFRKSADSYTVLGPWLVTADEIANPGDLNFSISVDGELRQSSNTRDLLADIPRLIELCSTIYTLYPGDVILTGTPDGVAPVKAGSVMHAKCDGIGEMTIPVLA